MVEGDVDLSYAGPQTGKSLFWLQFWTIFVLVLTAIAAFTCVRIEILNVQMEHYLPRDFSKDPGRWRVLLLTETRWRQLQSRFGDRSWLTRPLTVAERAEFDTERSREDANMDLRDMVQTFGLLQYPLLLVLLVGLPVMIFLQRRPWRGVLIVAMVMAGICTFFMFYDGYARSLGM